MVLDQIRNIFLILVEKRMSVFSKGTKKKVNKEPVKKVKVKITKNPDTKNISGEQAEALQNGEIPPGAIMNPMVIPDFFNNIRNNYYVANKIMWITGFIEWGLITEVMRRLNFYDDGTKDPITLYVASPGGECDAGWALVDMIEKLKHKGITVKTICAGSCSSMAAVILAAGKGTRMKSETTPKVLHEIMGKTLLGYVMDNVKNFVSEQFVIVGHHAEAVEKFVQNNYKNSKTVTITTIGYRSCGFYGLPKFRKF